MASALFIFVPSALAGGGPSCATATALVPDTLHNYGDVLSSASTSEWWSISSLLVGANKDLYAVVNPGYQTSLNIHVYLYKGSCSSLTLVNDKGYLTCNTCMVTVKDDPSANSDYFVEVRWVSGSGTYDIEAHAPAIAPVTCSANGQVSVNNWIACSLTLPVCTYPCTVHITVQARGDGLVSGTYKDVSCFNALLCSKEQDEPIYGGYSGDCVALGQFPDETIAVFVEITCTASIVY